MLHLAFIHSIVFKNVTCLFCLSSDGAKVNRPIVLIQSYNPNMLYIVLIVSIESERNLPVLLVQELLNLSTPSAGSRWMKWRSSRGSRWRKTCKRPVRSWRAKWRMPTTSTRPTCFGKVSLVVLLSGLIKKYNPAAVD